MTSIRNLHARTARWAHRVGQRLRPGPAWHTAYDRLAAARGQGTVEYIGIVVVVAALLVAVHSGLTGEVTHTVTAAITDSIKNAVETVSKKP
jgi:hypothetical protein